MYKPFARKICVINGETRAERRQKARAWIAAQRVAFDAERKRAREEAEERIRRCYADPAWGAPVPAVDLASVNWSRATAHEIAAKINADTPGVRATGWGNEIKFEFIFEEVTS